MPREHVIMKGSWTSLGPVSLATQSILLTTASCSLQAPYVCTGNRNFRSASWLAFPATETTLDSLPYNWQSPRGEKGEAHVCVREYCHPAFHHTRVIFKFYVSFL